MRVEGCTHSGVNAVERSNDEEHEHDEKHVTSTQDRHVALDRTASLVTKTTRTHDALRCMYMYVGHEGRLDIK